LRVLQATAFDNDNMDLLDRLQRYELVVIDDLGVERGTPYAMEQIYSVFDTRYRSGKPLIVTTNLSPNDFKNPENLSYERVYDRIIQTSPIVVKIEGESRRAEMGKAKREKHQNLLGF